MKISYTIHIVNSKFFEKTDNVSGSKIIIRYFITVFFLKKHEITFFFYLPCPFPQFLAFVAFNSVFLNDPFHSVLSNSFIQTY